MRRACSGLIIIALLAYQLAMSGAFSTALAQAPAAPMPCHMAMDQAPGADPAGPVSGHESDQCPLMLGVVCMAACAVLPQTTGEPVALVFRLVHLISETRELASLAVPPPQRPPKFV